MFKLLFLIFFILMLLMLVAFLVLLERKILSLDQIRKSPNITGFYSVLQTIMDSVKLLLKKYLYSLNMRFFFFFFSPIYGFIISVLSWFFLFIIFSFTTLECTMVISLFISSILVYSLVWASWSSNNVYSLISSVRAVAQMISYEVVMGFFFFFLMCKCNTYSWDSFIYLNLDYCPIFFFFFFFFMWIIIFCAEMNRTPFDLVESESELVSSYNVEYSSSGFTLLFLSEYMSIWFMSFLSSLLFFSCKSFFFFFVFFFILITLHLRATLPRYKFSDLISLTWKNLLPMVTLILIVFIL